MKFKAEILIIVLFVLTLFVYGQNPIDFELKSVTNQQVFKLSQAKGKFVALHFLLKTECPYCLRHTHEYSLQSETMPNVVQVFIKPDTESEIKQWASNFTQDELNKLPVYRDPDAKLADQFNIPGGYRFHNQVVHFPALILLNPDGREVFRYIGKDNTDRYSVNQLKEKIKELTDKE